MADPPPTRTCPVCRADLDDEQWKTHVLGERCTECGAPWCAARRAHRPFCTSK
ncbi:MAG TPA: hypothetical protein VHT97_03930 [Acidimicrobiales bacterium]|nr:hypothetical protein [Acidimicrobiales bacterium]